MSKTAHIKLYNEIYTWSEAGAREMLRKLDEARADADRIAMHVHSYGGSITEGNLIFNGMRGSEIPVDIVVDGIAASMAALLIPAADKAYMCENAFLMFHAPAAAYTSGRGTASEHKKVANVLEAQQDFFIKALMGKTGKSRKEVEKWMDGDNWFSAQQALDAGIIDGIVEPVTQDIEALAVEQVAEMDIKCLYDYFRASLEPSAPPQKPAAPSNDNSTNQNSNQMNLSEQLVAALGMEGKPTEEQFLAQIAKLRETAAETEALRTEVEAYKKAESDAAEAALVAKVDNAIKVERKAVEADRDSLMALGRANPEALDMMLEKLPAAKDISEGVTATAEPKDPWAVRRAEIENNKNK